MKYTEIIKKQCNSYYYSNSNYCIVGIPYENVCTKLSKRSTK